uniref:G-protein coupled receptors family 1 profile domain-containing protein n=1 Tax=Haplochromis burtoni TaxID=8153 RepID=A0A3Q2X3A4_HAPBU
MDNQSLNADILILGGLKVTPKFSIAAFISLLLVYIFIMVANIGLVVLIFMERSLHQPMYLLFCNMSVNEVFGSTIVVPHILRDLYVSDSERYIHYIVCVVQAFCVNLYGGVCHTILMTMTFDRYMAIYNVHCDNASLFKLSCEDVVINHVFGLSYSVLLLGSSIGSVTLTYIKIATVCLQSKTKTINSKALQTCATHLTLYIILMFSAFIIIILHRFPHLSDHRKMVSTVGEVALPALNAVIYGLQIKEIRQKIVVLLNF